MKYRNVTVSGEAATGTTTSAKELAGQLGWEYTNVGQLFRDYCAEHNLPLEEAGQRSDELTREVDLGLRRRLETETGLVAEGWLTGFMAQGILGTLKVLLVAPDEVRLKRLMAREGLSREAAEQQMERRAGGNKDKWRRVYEGEWEEWVGKGKIDFFDPDLYDVVIDTSKNGKEAVVGRVKKELGW